MNNNLPRCETDSGGELNILLNNRFLYGETGQALQKKIESLKIKEHCLYIIPSPLLGRGIDKLLTLLPDNSALLALECENSLADIFIQHQSEYTRSNPCFFFTRACSLQKIHTYLAENNLNSLQHCEIVTLNRGARLHSRLYSDIKKHCEKELKTWWINRFTIMKLSKVWIKNIIRNLPAVCISTPVILDVKPVVVAGAGESLEKSLNFIRKNRKSLNLIVVDTALSCFIENNLIPDAVFALEGQFHNIKDFELVAESGIPLITDLTSHYATWRFSQGQCSFFASEFEKNCLSDRLISSGLIPPEIPPLGSVGVSAMAYAMRCHFPLIFFTGLDFSFIPGKTHAKGSSYHRYYLRTADRINPAGNFKTDKLYRNTADIDRTRVTSDTMMFYGSQLRDLSESTCKVFDLRGSGIPLGYPGISFNDAEKLLKNSIEDNYTKAVLKSGSTDMDLYISFMKNEIMIIENLLKNWTAIKNGEMVFPSDCGYLFMHRPEYFKKEHPTLFMDYESEKHVRYIKKEWEKAEISLRQS